MKLGIFGVSWKVMTWIMTTSNASEYARFTKPQLHPFSPISTSLFDCFVYFDYFGYIMNTSEGAMIDETVAMPPSGGEQIRELNRLLQLGTPALVGPHNERVDLPETVYNILKDVVRYMAAGRAITLVPQKEQLTTQLAADMLGFSRPHLIKLLESGEIPYLKVGQHRRLMLKDVLAFQKRRDKARRSALDELAREAYKDGSYEGIPIPEGGSDE
jgi:excisionase family DNA binding protein